MNPSQGHNAYGDDQNARRYLVNLAAATRRALMLCLLLLAMPLLGQEQQELTQALIEQRIATLREAGAADSDETSRAYEAVQSSLNRAANHAREAARYLAELTEAPQREAQAQQRLDAMESEDISAEESGALSREELADELSLTQSQLRDANEQRDVLDRRLVARESNAEGARNRLEEIAARLGEMQDQVASIDPAAAPSLTEASQWMERAEQTALREERRALVGQLDSQAVRFSALRADREELQFTIDRLTRYASGLTARVRAEQSSLQAALPLDIEAGSPVFELGTRYQAINLQMREQKLALETRLAEVKAEREVVEGATRVINERFSRAKRVVQFATRAKRLAGPCWLTGRSLKNCAWTFRAGPFQGRSATW